MGGVALLRKSAISETGQDRTKVTIEVWPTDDQQKFAYALSIGAKINDLG